MRMAVWLVLLGGCAPHLYSGATSPQCLWDEPTNRWALQTPPEDTRCEGFGEGQTVPNVRVPDQHGEGVFLWQFYGQVVLLDISTMWCAPCQDLAAGTQETVEYYADEPFSYVTVLQENVHSEPPTQEDLNLWVDGFGIEAPVVGDGEKDTANAVQNGQYPAVLVIGPDLRVVERVNLTTDEEVHRAIDRALGL